MPCWSVCNMAAASPPEVTSRVVEVSNFAAMSTTAPAVSAPAAPTLSSDPDTLPSPLCHPGVAAAALSVAAPTPASDVPYLFACATNTSVLAVISADMPANFAACLSKPVWISAEVVLNDANCRSHAACSSAVAASTAAASAAAADPTPVADAPAAPAPAVALAAPAPASAPTRPAEAPTSAMPSRNACSDPAVGEMAASTSPKGAL